MTEFRTLAGKCTVTSGSIEVKESLIGPIKTAYHLSKLYFFVLAVYVPLFGFFIVLTWENGLPVLVSFVVIVSVLVVLRYRLSYGSGTLDADSISLDTVESVEVREDQLIPVLVVSYRQNNSVEKRVIRMPYSVLKNSSRELNKAIEAFDGKGIEIA
ncbi:hypothetical protein AUR64_02405 [Haloprofundus marisrubri]|uniref:Uncharacterized protein n=1 Tax=Haloprofundus marisrubri TaxID=1514971 RepID=A0A0W1R3C1_9EURY|nr:hypothetical protein [Haloprofundus marisrubri]KTG07713.1 hypothetical protein AUR64_02405 [Haloprofundus marisrubri]